MHRLLGLVFGLAWITTSGAARAAQPATDIARYALIVGSNTGGAGQLALRYAEDDAQRVAATLIELSGYPADAVDVVLRPTPAALLTHLDQLAARVAADRAADRPTRVMFYYSGHARATALDLGAEQLALADLRKRLVALSATLTIVVLDACQSGAFARVKSARAAADFSFNVHDQLSATGMAILSSSNATELSQESEQLRSGYFTHHLLVGMRGAGDLDQDGQVSIEEAHRYAYHQTVLATSLTAVGGQHPTRDYGFNAQGEVPLSFPRAASASIELPATLEGQTLIENRRARSVVAETYKARGAPVRIALAPGEYRVLVRRGDQVARCEIQVGPGGAVVDLDRCTIEPVVAVASKGASNGQVRALQLELAATASSERDSSFTNVLGQWGYRPSGIGVGVRLSAMRALAPRLQIGGFASLAGSPRWTAQDPEFGAMTFDWTTMTVGAIGRVTHRLGTTGLWAHCAAYAQLAGGVAVAWTRYENVWNAHSDQLSVGWAVMPGGGVHFDATAGVGFSLGYQFDSLRVHQDLSFDRVRPTSAHQAYIGVSYAY